MQVTDETGGKLNEKGMVRVDQAAALLSVSPRTIWRMIADGQLRAVRYRRCTRIAASELCNFTANTVEPEVV